MAWARPGSWLDSERGRSVGSWIRGFVGAVWEFVGSWIRGGVRGFVDGFVDSWVRELVVVFVGSWIVSRAFGFVWVSFHEWTLRAGRPDGNNGYTQKN